MYKSRKKLVPTFSSFLFKLIIKHYFLYKTRRVTICIRCIILNNLQVSQLILLNEAAQRDGVPLPDLVSSAQQIREAIKSLILAAQALVSETTDDVSYILNRSSEKIHSFFFFSISAGDLVILQSSEILFINVMF